ncbi:hypothetical protein PIB30_016514 [Stylosanthes scabra]|uniref:Uncharacterized protein n=1 Tax=Stylosanthes scabra TaxID=79078 RepID=A0ABU6Z6X9_9FABA|nr:hypothetical protein [Stylosanthes scabra]
MLLESGVANNLVKSISKDVAAYLKIIPDDKEIKDVNWDCGPSITLGPGGFNFKYLRKALNVIRKEFTALVREFFVSVIMPKKVKVVIGTLRTTDQLICAMVQEEENAYLIGQTGLPKDNIRFGANREGGLWNVFLRQSCPFCGSSQQEMVERLRKERLIMRFKIMADLNINYDKLTLNGLYCGDDSIFNKACSTMGCPCMKLLIKYIGLPLVANPKRAET